MGAEHSSTSRRVSPSDDAMTLVMRNNYCPLLFHTVHGDNVKLSKNKAVACRSEGFCKGIVFSDRPVKVEEPIYVKFLDISSNWSGALRIGFTMNDPALMKSKLPRYACPDLTSIQGNWAKAISERMAKKDSILYYYVDHSGDVHYGIDSKEHGVFFGGVNTSVKLWAVLDIYGNTVSVEFINPSSLNHDSIETAQNNLITSSRNTESPSFPESTSYQINSSLSFHPFHGRNAYLRSNSSVAVRRVGFNTLAYVFIENPLLLGEKIIVQISKVGANNNCSLIYGITSCDPTTLKTSDLPEHADDLIDRPEYWIVENDSNTYDAGDTIVYCVSVLGEVTVKKNGIFKSAIFHVDPTLPLWLFFNLSGSVSELNLIGSAGCDQSDTGVSDICDNFKNLEVSLPLRTNQPREAAGPSGQQSTSECVICYEHPVNCALYKCGHMCMCYDCASKMWNSSSIVHCPICREVIQDVIRIYR